MSDWTAGYVADIGYTFGYYTELNPLRLKLAFLNKGLICPQVGTACELGFGQGLSTNVHAAASVTQWYGTDFNPAQAGYGQELAQASRAAIQLYDEAFSEFCSRTDLPDFDYIGLHGIWSWISDENRQIIVDFIRRKLKVGGVLYISYNTLPGWASFAPLRHLMTEHAEIMGSEGRGIVNRIDGALEFTEKLLATNPAFVRANPTVTDRLSKMKEHDRHYLAHEYFNRDWHPMHFSTMASWLASAKVQFACSANYLDAIEVVNVTAEQQAFLAEIPDPMFRQSVRDFMVNQQFRKDYWVKGERKLSALQQAEALHAQTVLLTTHRPDIPMNITTTIGQVALQEAVYEPILDMLADHKPKTLGKISQGLKDQNIQFSQLMQAVLLLSGAGHLHSVQSFTPEVSETARRLNDLLIYQAKGSSDVQYLASPVTGGGHVVNRFQQLFLGAIRQGLKSPEEWAQATWKILESQNQKLIRNGKTLEAAEENLKELIEQATTFAAKQLPILKALQIV